MSKSKLLVFGVAAAAGVGLGVSFAYHIWQSNRRKRHSKDVINKLVRILDHPHVFIHDIAQLREKLLKIVDGGLQKLLILSDFDHTLSKYTVNGMRGQTAHGVVEKASCMADEFKEKVAQAKAKYYPLEMSPNLTKEEKIPLMVEWFSKVHDLMVETGVEKRSLPGMVSEANISLRDGVDELFRILKDNGIPLLILSAGLGDVLQEVIHKQSTVHSNMKIISNFMDFDMEGRCRGFQGHLIHSFNKHEIVNYNKSYFDEVKSHENLILLGDNLGDPNMADGMTFADTILRIGFLNADVERSLPTYQNAYDIVLVEDDTTDIINVLIKEIIKYAS